MKLIHLSDLHLGKRVGEYSMIEDQSYILDRIIEIISDEAPQAVLIAGDIYDKPVPPAEAVELFDRFLVQLSKKKLQVFVISGNHDSPERLAFGGRLMDLSGVHMCPVYDGTLKPYVLEDAYGRVNIYSLPFLKPAHVRRFYPEETIETYTDAIAKTLQDVVFSSDERNVLLCHQYVTGAFRSDSEESPVGGLDNVDASVFDGFDYVALGHIHGPQNIDSKRLRYCGTPLKYSFSEAAQEKSVTVVELGPKNAETGTAELSLRTVPLLPLRDMAELKGSYAELTLRRNYENTSLQEDYVHIILEEEEDIPDAMARLRVIYHNLMKLDYDNRRTRAQGEGISAAETDNRTPLELFAELYEKQNGQPLSPIQTEYLSKLIETIWGEQA